MRLPLVMAGRCLPCHTDHVSSSPVPYCRRFKVWVVAALVIFVALYFTVVGLYAGSGDVVTSGGSET